MGIPFYLTHPPSFTKLNYGGQEGAKNAKVRKEDKKYDS